MCSDTLPPNNKNTTVVALLQLLTLDEQNIVTTNTDIKTGRGKKSYSMGIIYVDVYYID